MKTPSSASSELLDNETASHIEALHTETLFHGTGRLANGYDDHDKSKPNYTVVDILQKVINEGLQPQKDHVSRLLLPVENTISLTRNRMYAACYAEMFGMDHKERTHLARKYGSSEVWKRYFMSTSMKEARSLKMLPWFPRIVKHLWTRFTPEERQLFADAKHHERRWYVNRANVEGNHPLIFGIDEKEVTPLELPPGLSMFEIRSGNPIPPTAIKFVEVPEVFVQQTTDLMARLGAPEIHVVSYEKAEAVCYEQGFEACTRPNTL